MRLCTECFWDDWDRIVDIYPERTETIPEYINDPGNYKIIILESGILHGKCGDEEGDIKAPALILLTQKDQVEVKIMQKAKMNILFFNPTVIRDEFTFERIDSGEFDNLPGQNIFQDFILISSFRRFENVRDRVLLLPLNDLEKVKNLFTSAECELKGQLDGFWPCRSRSYLMELLFYIVYSLYMQRETESSSPEDEECNEFQQITKYLNENIRDDITLDTLTSEFHINRNKLNDLFEKNASMTCLNYLLNLRMDLAKILLTKTEIPIGEVAVRVGYPDANYFAKVFKKYTGKTPKKYRYK